MRDALAIYITLLLIVTVAIAQVLYWKLVIARDHAVCDELPDMDWLHEQVETWVGFEADEAEPVLAGDPVLVGV